MGRPPSHGGPTFRFNPNEVAEMEAILQAHNTQMPSREILTSLSEKFSNSPDRSEKLVVQMKQVWNWFQNRRYALRAKTAKVPVKLSVSPATPNDLGAVRNVPQAPPHIYVPASPAIVRNIPQVPHLIPSASVQTAGQNGSDYSQMEFEAKSARDGAWYDVATFISHRSVETGDPEVLVRFAGFGAEEDEWVNIRKHVRQRSLPCESSECVAVLPGDLILCFQEGKDQALYFDAHVLDAQRRRHDVRGCRCRFLVRYDHDQSEEIVPLRKICRRPETDYRMPQLHAESANRNRNTTGPEPHSGNTVKVYLSPDASQKQQHNAVALAETKELPPKTEMPANTRPAHAPVSHANSSTAMAAINNAAAAITLPAQTSVPVATSTNITPAAHSSVLVATSMNIAPVAPSCVPVATTNIVPAAQSNVPVATSTNIAPDAQSSVPVATSTNITPVSTSTNTIAHSNVSGFTLYAGSSSTPSVQLIDSGTPVSIVAAVSTVGHSIAAGATSSMTTQYANSPASGCAASVVTVTTPVANSSAAGSTDSSVTTTTSTADYNVHGVAESVSTARTPFANSNVSGVSDAVATASAPVASPAPVGASVSDDKIHLVDEFEVLPESASELGANVENEDSQLAEITASNSTSSSVVEDKTSIDFR